jgi:hypothetical protein
MLFIFFGIKGLFTKNSAFQAKQSILHTNVTFYGGCIKMCEDFTQHLGDKRTGYCITTTHHLTLPFSPKNFLRKATLQSSASHPTFLFHGLKIKLKVRHFDTIEVIEGES